MEGSRVQGDPSVKPIEVKDDVVRTRPKLVRKMRWVMRAGLIGGPVVFAIGLFQFLEVKRLASEGVTVHETVRRLGIARTTVQIWRRRWVEAGQEDVHERLSDRPRSGAPATYTPEQVCAIVAIACERPEDSERPITHWTRREIADEAVKRGIVESISQRAIGHFLKRCQPATASHTRLADGKTRRTL